MCVLDSTSQNVLSKMIQRALGTRLGREGSGHSVNTELDGGRGREREGGESADNQNTSNQQVRSRRKNKILKCITMNAQSLVSKMPEFKVIFRDKKNTYNQCHRIMGTRMA